MPVAPHCSRKQLWPLPIYAVTQDTGANGLLASGLTYAEACLLAEEHPKRQVVIEPERVTVVDQALDNLQARRKASRDLHGAITLRQPPRCAAS